MIRWRAAKSCAYENRSRGYANERERIAAAHCFSGEKRRLLCLFVLAPAVFAAEDHAINRFYSRYACICCVFFSFFVSEVYTCFLIYRCGKSVKEGV